jgi:hypothetical protein
MTQKINKILINIILSDVIEKESSNKKKIKTKINRNQKYKNQI